MNYKSIIILILSIFVLLTIAGVSAGEVNGTTVVSADDSQIEPLDSNQINDKNLQASEDDGEALQAVQDNASETKSASADEVKLTRPITDDGNTIKAQEKSDGKIKTQLKASSITTTYNSNKKLVITLKDSQGKAISGVKLTVKIKSVKTLKTDKNGQVKVKTNALAPKTYTTKITFNGNDKYLKSTKSVKVKIKKANFQITAKAKAFLLKTKTKKYTVTLKSRTGKPIKKAKGSLKVNGRIYKATTNSKGKATFKITKLNKKGNYKATITFKGNKYYNKLTKKTKISVVSSIKTDKKDNKNNNVPVQNQTGQKTNNTSANLKDASMNLSADEITVGENATISVTLPNDATGNVSASANDNVYSASILNGNAAITIPDLNVGNYNILVIYSGDAKYNRATGNVNLVVNEIPKINLVLNITAPAIVVGENAVIVVTGLENATGRISASFTNGYEYLVPIVNGTATITVPGLINNSTALISYSGDDKYESATADANITVVDSLTLIAEDFVMLYDSGSRFKAKVVDSNGNSYPNQVVTFNINGTSYDRTTDSNGEAELIINLPPGKYNITSTYKNRNFSNNIEVLPLISANDLRKPFTDEIEFIAKVVDNQGNPNPNQLVTFNIEGESYNRTTDENGTAKLEVNYIYGGNDNGYVYNYAGNYVITSNYNGYIISNNIEIIPILDAEDLIKVYGTSSPFEVRILGLQGNYGGHVIEFEINGVYYHRITDSQGHAKLNINLMAGEYIVTSSYEGYSIKNMVTVLAS